MAIFWCEVGNVFYRFLLCDNFSEKLNIRACFQGESVGLGSIAKTSSARLSLMIDTHHLLTSSDELDTLYHYLTV